MAFSVGFIPDMEKAAPLNVEDKFGLNGMEFKGQELLEVSAVTIPSNPDALQRFVKTPTLHPVIAEIAEERLADQPEPEAAAIDVAALMERSEQLERVTAPPETEEVVEENDAS